MKRILVDMSATILHHGHIRLLQKAKKIGHVVVGLCTDDEILKTKGYMPELAFEYRKEILESICYVDEVIPAPWLIDNTFLDKHDIDLLVHGHDNSNPIAPERIVTFPRTEDVSSSDIREYVAQAYLSSFLTNQTLPATLKKLCKELLKIHSK